MGGHGQINRVLTQREARAHVNIIQPPYRQVLHAPPLQVVDFQAVLFVGAQYPAHGRVGGVNPNRGVIRRIALTHHWVGLHRRFYHRQNRWQLHRRGLPLERAFKQLAVTAILHQHLQAFWRLANSQLLRLNQAAKRQVCNRRPVFALLLVEVQLSRFRIKPQHASRHHSHRAC